MAPNSNSAKILWPPMEVEGGIVARLVADGDKSRPERWNGKGWEAFPALDLGSLVFARELSPKDLEAKGISPVSY